MLADRGIKADLKDQGPQARQAKILTGWVLAYRLMMRVRGRDAKASRGCCGRPGWHPCSFLRGFARFVGNDSP
jgi:hypothetical protein